MTSTCFWTDAVGCSEVCPVQNYVAYKAGDFGIILKTSDSTLHAFFDPGIFNGPFYIEHARVFADNSYGGCGYANAAPIPPWIPSDYPFISSIPGLGGSVPYVDKGRLSLAPTLETIQINGCGGPKNVTGYIMPLNQLLTMCGDNGDIYNSFVTQNNNVGCMSVYLVYFHLVAPGNYETYFGAESSSCY